MANIPTDLPDATRFYINGEWVQPLGSKRHDIINPATKEAIGSVALGTEKDANLAIAAAKEAFANFSKWTLAQRLDLLRAIHAKLIERKSDIAEAVHQTMGAPTGLARSAQAGSGPQHFAELIRILEDYPFTQMMGTTQVAREPIGVCTLITPWNWPVNQVATKVAPALAAGCTMILKPSENTPLDAVILAQIIDEVGAPPGVFNLVHGLGPEIGSALCQHKDVDMISFTGSTRAGIEISKLAADGVKRVALELGGKSACILLEDTDLENAIPQIVQGVMLNSGQSCNATTRLLVPKALHDHVGALAVTAANALTLGVNGNLGPIANAGQYARVRNYIETGISEGAVLLAGGTEAPSDLANGYFIEPTIFGNVRPGMTIETEEIFGPVMTITPYDSLSDAIEIANNSEYGLSGAVWSANRDKAVEVAKELRTGMVHINGAGLNSAAPFGGYKKSGNGREWGIFGLEEFLEVKSIYGAGD